VQGSVAHAPRFAARGRDPLGLAELAELPTDLVNG
jgi:hypothetical protein